jgi:tRNA-guanine family transglycosylase
MLTFEVLAREGQARRGRLGLAHGTVETPVFMPVGTYGSVKGVLPSSLEAMGAEIILGNTFHLWLRPGLDVVARFGGLHRFEGWPRPILTDSGGFQVWSLGANAKVSELGVAFQSPGQRRQAAADARGQHADPARPRQRHRHAIRRVHRRTRSRAASPARPRRGSRWR